jgi:hypothetical protein
MMSQVVTCTDMLQGIMVYPAFQFTPDASRVMFISLYGKFHSGLIKQKINFYLFQLLQASKNSLL